MKVYVDGRMSIKVASDAEKGEKVQVSVWVDPKTMSKEQKEVAREYNNSLYMPMLVVYKNRAKALYNIFLDLYNSDGFETVVNPNTGKPIGGEGSRLSIRCIDAYIYPRFSTKTNSFWADDIQLDVKCCERIGLSTGKFSSMNLTELNMLREYFNETQKIIKKLAGDDVVPQEVREEAARLARKYNF